MLLVSLVHNTATSWVVEQVQQDIGQSGQKVQLQAVKIGQQGALGNAAVLLKCQRSGYKALTGNEQAEVI